MANEINQLAAVITCHAFNADRSRVALCPNNNEVHVFGRAQGGGWGLESVLKEHDQTVLGLDWAPNTDRIVSCSQDRNAYVWTQADGKWQPILVVLRINRAATCVKWSPQENKFAVASGAKVVSVCHFEEEGNWWISKHIKKHRSTVLTLDWHPNNYLLATGSSDFKARVFSAYIKGVDKAPPAASGSGAFGGKVGPFGELLAELDQCQGWVHAVAWHPAGNLLAFAGHDARLALADCAAAPPAVSVLRAPSLPYLGLLWTSASQLLAVGHEPNPQLYALQGNRLALGAKLDKPEEKKAAAADAKAIFQAREKTGQDARDQSLGTKHQNSIKTVTAFEGAAGACSQVATSGIDGKLIIWAL
jgi:actin related protein 2/3 complex subunit 1A/1B